MDMLKYSRFGIQNFKGFFQGACVLIQVSLAALGVNDHMRGFSSREARRAPALQLSRCADIPGQATEPLEYSSTPSQKGIEPALDSFGVTIEDFSATLEKGYNMLGGSVVVINSSPRPRKQVNTEHCRRLR